jgi:cytoskeletal protein RodZ
MFDKLSEELRRAREEKKLSIHQLSLKTKIDPKFLEAMDAGDFAFLPEIYVKAFVKEYARAVGLDIERVSKKYDAAKEGRYFEEEEKKANEIKVEEKKELPKREAPITLQKESEPVPKYNPPVQSYDATTHSGNQGSAAFHLGNKNMMFIGFALGGIILLIIIYFLFFSNGTEIVVPEKPFEEIVQESKQRYEDNVKKDESTAADEVIHGDSLNLNIKANDTLWVRIIVDDKRMDEFTLFPNSNKSINAINNYKITFGNSGAVELQLNNKQLKFTGRGNSVMHVLIDGRGLTYLTAPPVVN